MPAILLKCAQRALSRRKHVLKRGCKNTVRLLSSDVSYLTPSPLPTHAGEKNFKRPSCCRIILCEYYAYVAKCNWVTFGERAQSATPLLRGRNIYIYISSPQRNITVILPTAFIHNYHFYLHLHFPFCRLFMLGVGTLQHATLERRHYWDHRAAKENDTPLLCSRSLLEALIQQRAPHGPKQLHLPTFLRQPFLNSNTPAPFLCQYKFTCINLCCYRHVNLFLKNTSND